MSHLGEHVLPNSLCRPLAARQADGKRRYASLTLLLDTFFSGPCAHHDESNEHTPRVYASFTLSDCSEQRGECAVM